MDDEQKDEDEKKKKKSAEWKATSNDIYKYQQQLIPAKFSLRVHSLHESTDEQRVTVSLV